MRGICKACGESDRLLDDTGRCYLDCVGSSYKDEVRCPKCGHRFDYEVCDYEGETEHDVECPKCDYEFEIGIEIDYSFYLHSPERIIEEKSDE